MSITRHYRDRDVVRWTIRRVWRQQGATWDRVMLSGELTIPEGSQGAREVLLAVLREATADLELGVALPDQAL